MAAHRLLLAFIPFCLLAEFLRTHYNFTKTKEEIFRPLLGVRGESHSAIITGGTTLDDITPYLGGEAYFRYVTLRATVGPSFDLLLGYQDIGATLAVLGNISF